MLQPGRGQVFVTMPLQAAGIGLLHGGCCMALEGFTAVGVTEEGAGFGLGWQISSSCFEVLKERMN